MSETKTIDMRACIGSDTLCALNGHLDFFFLNRDITDILMDDDNFCNVQVAQDIWQSTQNNIVIPEGLICDVEYVYGGYLQIDKSVNSHDLDIQDEYYFNIEGEHEITAIQVTGIAEGWAYAWQQDQRGGE